MVRPVDAVCPFILLTEHINKYFAIDQIYINCCPKQRQTCLVSSFRHSRYLNFNFFFCPRFVAAKEAILVALISCLFIQLAF